MRDELRALFGRTPAAPASRELPKGWESHLDSEGGTVLSRSRSVRATQARVMALLAAGCVATLGLVVRSAGPAGLASREFLIPVTLLILPLIAGVAWLGLGGSHLRIRSSTSRSRYARGRGTAASTRR